MVLESHSRDRLPGLIMDSCLIPGCITYWKMDKETHGIILIFVLFLYIVFAFLALFLNRITIDINSVHKLPLT